MALIQFPLFGRESGGAGALDVPGAVIDEQNARRLGSDAARGCGEEARVGFGHAKIARVTADVEQRVVAERDPHVRRPVPFLIGPEMDPIAVSP
jgi:hypothetical protein